MWIDSIEFRVSCASGLYIKYISPVSSNCGVFLRRDETSRSFLPSFLPSSLPSVGAQLARRRSAFIISLCVPGYSKWFIYRQQRRRCLIGTWRNLVRRPSTGSNKFQYSCKPAVSICIHQLESSCIGQYSCQKESWIIQETLMKYYFTK